MITAFSRKEHWANLPPDHYKEFIDEDLLNEFEMMWALRERFPLHFTVFKQIASHLAHEANVEQVFSRAGRLSETNIDPAFLGHIVMGHVNKNAFKPTLKDMKAKYYEMFRGKGEEIDLDDSE